MITGRLLILLIGCMLMPVCLGARVYQFPMLHYTKENGTPGNRIYYVYSDSKGYIWLATDNGVARYNGVRFEVFTTLDGLADNEVYFFREDLYGRLWIATNNGRLCYYSDGVFHNAGNTAMLRLDMQSPHIRMITPNRDSSVSIDYEDARIELTVYKHHVVHRLVPDISNEKKKFLIFRKKLSADTTLLALEDRDILLDSLGRTRMERKRSVRYTAAKVTQKIMHIVSDSGIHAEDGRLVRMLPSTFSRAENEVYAVYQDAEHFFVATNTGLYIDDTMVVLPGHRISSISVDKAGNYWLATLDDGVYCLGKNFIRTSIQENAYTGSARYCYQDSNWLFFTTANNNVYARGRDGRLGCVFDYSSVAGSNPMQDFNPVHLVEREGDTYRYYAIYGRHRIFIDNVHLPSRHVYTRPNIFGTVGVKSMLSAGSKIWIQCRSSIVYMHNATGFLADEAAHTFNVNVGTSYRVFGMARLGDSTILYAPAMGIREIKGERSMAIPALDKLAFSNLCVAGDYLAGVTMDARLVICTDIAGRPHVDTVRGQNCIWQRMYQLDATHLLVSTNNLYRMIALPAGGQGAVKIHTIENPFIPLDAEAVCSDGKVCNFFRNGSITSVDLEKLTVRPAPPEVLFGHLQTRKRSVPVSGEMMLSYGEARNVTVSFSVISFNSRDVRAEFSVSGSGEDDWRSISGNEINLNNLKYGDHYIKVRARTLSSAPGIAAVFHIHVSQPVWTTWWFGSICATVLLLGIFLLVRARVKQVINKREKEHDAQLKYLRAEYTAMNALMNPHFIFNTLNNVQSMFHANDLEGANEYLRIFASLIRQNMQNISRELIPLQMEIDLVSKYLYLEKMRFENKLSFAVEIQDGLDTTDIKVPPLLIQPLVENSIKHGILPLDADNGFIAVAIRERNNILIIEVKDNGQGLKHPANQDDAHESIGLSNIRKRIHHLGIIQNKHITFDIRETKDEHGQHEFTIVTISIPV